MNNLIDWLSVALVGIVRTLLIPVNLYRLNR